MPLLFKPIAVFLATIIGSIVARVFLAIGIGVITYNSIDTALDNILSTVESSWGGLPTEIFSIASLAGFDEAITIIISAVSSAVSLKVTSGVLKRIGFVSGE